jgi:mRNA-degrading endonuclease RelE of RelBE toxin-antitoxin system
VLQIVFNEISAAEISKMDTLDQLELLDAFKVTEADLSNLDGDRFGHLTRDGKTLYRFRANDCRIYFEVADKSVIVHRVLHKNSFSDFLFRSQMPLSEDEELSKSKHFWNLIDEGRKARKM